MATNLLWIVALAAAAAGWVAVQQAWLRSFPEAAADGDALAGRSDCHAGSCGGGRGDANCLGEDCPRHDSEH